MPETLYAILTTGDVLKITDVTALALDSSLTIYPGDSYVNAWVEQEVVLGTYSGDVATNIKGDPLSAGQAKRDESWKCSVWKFTRGASLPIFQLSWFNVEAICNLRPDVADATANAYLLLKSGHVAVYSGLAASTSAINPASNLTIYPGDYWRKEYVEQTADDVTGFSASVVLTKQEGDSALGTALRDEVFQASHYEFTRTGLITLYAPWRSVVGGPATSYPNRA